MSLESNMICPICGGQLGYLQWYDSCNWYRICEKCGHVEEGYDRD